MCKAPVQEFVFLFLCVGCVCVCWVLCVSVSLSLCVCVFFVCVCVGGRACISSMVSFLVFWGGASETVVL